MYTGNENIIQSFPRDTAPTGNVRKGHNYNRDLKFIETGAGCNFNVSREINANEAVALVDGLDRLIRNVKEILRQNPESPTIQKIWAIVRHEVFLYKRGAMGVLASWGQGFYGQLGSGKEISKITSPTIIPRVADASFLEIAVGAGHVLAIDSASRIFSWGCGGSGRLGHDDFEDRYIPTQISLLGEYHSEQCSAGDAHSGVLVTSRKVDRLKQVKKVGTFGRNGHGRLGNGKTNNSKRPISVDNFLPSFANAKPRQICCGGAHTLLLFEKRVPKSSSNPMAMETYVACWGYGENGQLGTGFLGHQLFPNKVRLPKWEIISEVSAGRSWSLARTVGGDLYTWGKGLRGQLGQLDVKISVAPVKLESFASFIKLGSNYSHNLCIGTHRSHLNQIIAGEHFDSKDPLSPIISPNMDRMECSSLRHFNCCRSENLRAKDYFRASCVDCDLKYVCHACIKLCHRGHDILVDELNNEKEEILSVSTAKHNLSTFERITEGSGNFRRKKYASETIASTIPNKKYTKTGTKVSIDAVRYKNDKNTLMQIQLPDDAKAVCKGFTRTARKIIQCFLVV